MKKYLFGVFAIALAVTFSAFTAANKSNVATDYATVEFTGLNDGDFMDDAYWTVTTSPEVVCEPLAIEPTVCRFTIDETAFGSQIVDGEDVVGFLSAELIDEYSDLISNAKVSDLNKKESITP